MLHTRIPIPLFGIWVGACLWTATGPRAQVRASYLGIDINKTPAASPVLHFGPDFGREVVHPAERKFLRFNNTILFSGSTAATGRELWKFDGTKVTLVKDIYPGPYSSRPTFLVSAGPKIFFVAEDPSKGKEIWVSDGTPRGTKIFMDVEPGRAGSNPYSLIPLKNGKIVFVRSRKGSGAEPWVSDGTAAGTFLLKDIRAGGWSSWPSRLVANAAGTKVFFRADDGVNGFEPWVTDGTRAGTMMLKDIFKGPRSSNSDYFTPIGTTKVVFQASDFDGTTAHGTELWISDGTPAGTVFLKDVYSGPSSGTFLRQGVSLGSKVLFQGRTAANGLEPWVTDGTKAGTVLLRDIVPGTGDALISESVLSAGRGWFVVEAAGGTYEIWSTTGTPAGTRRFLGGLSSIPRYLEVSKGKLFFSMYRSGFGNEPWISNGTAAGTTVLKDLYPGGKSGYGSYLTEVIPGVVAMYGRTPTAGYELVSTKGTAATTVVHDTNRWAYGPITESERIGQLTSRFGRVLFTATDGTAVGLHGQELWVTKGTAATTKLVKDIHPGPKNGVSSFGASFCRLGDKVLFAADDGVKGLELWVTDGTAAGTKLLKDIFPGPGSSNPGWLTRIGGKVFFHASRTYAENGLWVTDGTAAGTRLVARINPAGTGSYPHWFAPLGDRVVFSAFTRALGYELWISDGTASGTKLVKDILPGPMGSHPMYLTPFRGKVYFSADDGQTVSGHGRELWQTDGTAGGTKLVKDIEPGYRSSAPAYLIVRAGLLVFSASSRPGGRQVFQSDGTTGGTVPYFSLGAGELNPFDLTKVGERRIYFGGVGPLGFEPEFVTFNGRIPGPVRFLDFAPGGLSSHPGNFTGGRHVFCLDSGRIFMKGNLNPSSDERIFRIDNGATTHSIGDVRGSTILTGDKDPVLNTTVNLKGTTGISNPIHVLILSAPTETPIKVFPHWYAYYDPSKQIVLGAWSGVSFTSSLRIPNNKNLKGLRVVVQDWVLNAKTAPAGWELSNGLFMVLGT